MDKWDLFQLNQFFCLLYIIMHLCIVNYIKLCLFISWKNKKMANLYEYLFPPTISVSIFN